MKKTAQPNQSLGAQQFILNAALSKAVSRKELSVGTVAFIQKVLTILGVPAIDALPGSVTLYDLSFAIRNQITPEELYVATKLISKAMSPLVSPRLTVDDYMSELKYYKQLVAGVKQAREEIEFAGKDAYSMAIVKRFIAVVTQNGLSGFDAFACRLRAGAVENLDQQCIVVTIVEILERLGVQFSQDTQQWQEDTIMLNLDRLGAICNYTGSELAKLAWAITPRDGMNPMFRLAGELTEILEEFHQKPDTRFGDYSRKIDVLTYLLTKASNICIGDELAWEEFRTTLERRLSDYDARISPTGF